MIRFTFPPLFQIGVPFPPYSAAIRKCFFSSILRSKSIHPPSPLPRPPTPFSFPFSLGPISYVFRCEGHPVSFFPILLPRVLLEGPPHPFPRLTPGRDKGVFSFLLPDHLGKVGYGLPLSRMCPLLAEPVRVIISESESSVLSDPGEGAKESFRPVPPHN